MNTKQNHRWLFALIGAWIFSSLTCSLAADHVAIPVSHPLKPLTVKVTLHSGSISVTGYPGKEILLDVKSRQERNRRNNPSGSDALKRISSPGTGLDIGEENNTVSIEDGNYHGAVDISLQVPLRTSLVLNTSGGGNIAVNAIEGDVKINNSVAQNGQPNPSGKRDARFAVQKGRANFSRQRDSRFGNIEIHQVKGEVEINNGRGNVTLDRISGNAIANALNGNLRASFLALKPGKPVSLSSMNGVIDVWLPPAIKANVTLQSSGGEIHSDFDIKINSTDVAFLSGGASGKRTAGSSRMQRIVAGKINGGGQEVQVRTYKGNILIRKFSEAAQRPQAK